LIISGEAKQSLEAARECTPHATFMGMPWVTINGKPVDAIFRLASRKDIIRLYENVNPERIERPENYDLDCMIAQEEFLRATVVFPMFGLINDQAVGDVHVLMGRIIEASGFTNGNEVGRLLELGRQAAKINYETSIFAAICSAFPTITPEDIDNWDLPRIVRHTVLAETILGRSAFDPIHSNIPQQPSYEQLADIKRQSRMKAYDRHLEGATAQRKPIPSHLQKPPSNSVVDLPTFTAGTKGEAVVNTQQANKMLKEFGF